MALDLLWSWSYWKTSQTVSHSILRVVCRWCIASRWGLDAMPFGRFEFEPLTELSSATRCRVFGCSWTCKCDAIDSVPRQSSLADKRPNRWSPSSSGIFQPFDNRKGGVISLGLISMGLQTVSSWQTLSLEHGFSDLAGRALGILARWLCGSTSS